MPDIEKVFAAYVQEEIEKFKGMTHNVKTIDDLAGVTLATLYPEFRIKDQEVVGVFNPFTTGEFGTLSDLGQGSSLLVLLPFYERVIACVERIPAEYFSAYYGVDISSFIDLVQAGRVLPLLPGAMDAFPLFGGSKLDHLAALFSQGWPTSDRPFRLSQRVAINRLSDDAEANTIKEFTQAAVAAALKIFGEDNANAFNFIKLCNRAIYRGDFLLVITWIILAKRYRELLEPSFPKHWATFTVTIIDFRDYFFHMGLIVPGGSVSYSGVGFDWLRTELELKKSRAGDLGIEDLDDHRFVVFDQLTKANRVPSFDELVVLRRGFIHEPIEAVGDIAKFMKWLERSANVEENQKIMQAFSRNLRQGRYKDAIVGDLAGAQEVIEELNREIKKVSFVVRTSSMLIEAGATVGAALAGAILGNALAADQLAALFSMCGALAASKLTENLSSDIAEAAMSLPFRNNAAFLIWKKRQE
jgi:hypothetical protein